MKFCPKCGAQLDDNVKFCSTCGSAQSAPAFHNPPAYRSNPGYQNNAGYQNVPPVNNGNAANIVRTPVKTDYNLVMYILLSIVTCGIYAYYIIYKMAQDVNQMCAEDGDSVGGLGMYILLSIVTCGFYSFYWLYKIQNRLQANGPRYGVPIQENGTTVLVWLILGSLLCGIGSFVAFHIVFKSCNAVGAAYNARYFYGRSF